MREWKKGKREVRKIEVKMRGVGWIEVKIVRQNILFQH